MSEAVASSSTSKDLADQLENRKNRRNAPAKFAHVVLKTPRFEEMIAWYITVLDAIEMYHDDNLCFITYDDEHHRVGFVRVPSVVRFPGVLLSKKRKILGPDHVAYTYATLSDLVGTYRRLADMDIRPVWCINHGPTTSLYYEDPDGNRLELQYDNYPSPEDLTVYLKGGDFDDNPVGVEFDPDVLERRLNQGVELSELIKRGSAPPDHGRARSGKEALRWKTI